MEHIKATIKRWGNSFGIVVPAQFMKKEALDEGSEVTVTIQSHTKTQVKDVFGILKGKLKKDTQEALDDIDKEFWPNDE